MEFLGEEYQTPQPREVHNDYLENFVEGGTIGGFLFLFIIGSVFYGVSNTMFSNITNREFLLLSSVVASIVAVMVHAFFFFPFRLASSAMMFWISLALLCSLSVVTPMVSIPSTWIIPTFIALSVAAILWEGSIKQNIANYYFLKQSFARNGNNKEKYLTKAVELCPKNSMFRTHMMLGYTHSFPDIAEKQGNFTYNFYDGIITEWGMYTNLGVIKSIRGKYDEAVECFSNAINSNPRFEPALAGIRSVWAKAPLPRRRLTLKQMTQEGLLALKLSQTEISKQQAIMENIVLKEKLKLNIPIEWPFDTEKGIFLTPEEANDLKKQKKGEQ